MDGNRDHLVKFMTARFSSSPCVFAEVGVWTGTFSSRVLREVNVIQAHLVDPWKYTKELAATSLPTKPYCLDVPFERVNSQEHLDQIHDAVLALFAGDPRIHIHRKESLEAVCSFKDECFDWVYIDGDHSFEAVKQDISAWFPKVKVGGFISGDDYEWTYHGRPVKRAVDGFLACTCGAKILSKDTGQWLVQRIA